MNIEQALDHLNGHDVRAMIVKDGDLYAIVDGPLIKIGNYYTVQGLGVDEAFFYLTDVKEIYIKRDITIVMVELA